MEDDTPAPPATDSATDSETLARLDEMLLGGPRVLTRQQVADAAGIPVDHADRLWRALGFSAVEDDVPAFTQGDLDALRAVTRLADLGVLDEDQAVSIARFLGRTMSRFANIGGDLVSAWLVRQMEEGRTEDPVQDGADMATEVIPHTEALMRHIWRRHTAVVAGGFLHFATGEYTHAPDQAVGFADLSGFTALSRRLEDADLVRLVDTFEARASETVTDGGGHVVKTVGDGVLFVVADPVAAAEVALRLSEAPAGNGEVQVRVGLAVGPVLSWVGDVYGETVNLAARLTSIARPATVLVDRVAAKRLADTPAYRTERLRPRKVRGYDRIQASVLRRVEGEPTG